MPKKIYLLIQTIIYILFIYADFNGINSSLIKYSGIIINFIFSFYLYIKKDLDDILLPLALILTAIADYFLLIKDNNYQWGILCFCLVQTIYAYKIDKLKSIPIRILFLIICILILKISNQSFNLTNILAIYSITNLTLNVIISFIKNKNMFSIALLLFWLCDINVGIYNLQIKYIYPIAGMLMWIFYFPSQILLTISGGDHEKK